MLIGWVHGLEAVRMCSLLGSGRPCGFTILLS